MSEQRHVVKRQIIELAVQNSATAAALQDEASRVYRQRIVPLIEQYCNELSQPDLLYRIESLELDLGKLDVKAFEEQFVAKVKTSLWDALAAQINSQDQAVAQRGRNPKTLSALELFVFFVRTGSLPWWADDSQSQLLTENLNRLLQETPQELRRLLQVLAREENSCQRIVGHYEDIQLAQLASLLVPAFKTSLPQDTRSLTAILQKTKAGGVWPPSQLRQRVWKNILQVAALGGEHYVTPRVFYQAVLGRIAPELGKTSSVLMVELQQVLSDGPTRGSHARRVKALIAGSGNDPLEQRLRQLEAASESPASDVWAGLRALVPGLSDPLRAQWLAALKALKEGASARRILKLLRTELGTQSVEQLSALAQLLEPAAASTGKPAMIAGPGKELVARLRRYQADSVGPLGEVWATLQVLCLRLPPQAQAAWLNALEATGSESAAGGAIRLLNADPVQHGLRLDERAKLLKMFRDANVPGAAAAQTPLDLHFSEADELSVSNAGLVILWPFLNSFFTHLALVEDKQFKDLAARQRAVGLLQVIAAQDATPPEYLLPLNKVLCGMELKQVFDFGPPLLKSEKKECADLLKAVIGQVPILRNMSAAGFRGNFLLRSGLLVAHHGYWLLRVERQSYDVVLERFPWSWEWVKLPWMDMPLRVEW